ncbi:MAG: HAD-IC family P-type ATPase, partial [Clostridia bacterium]
MQGLSKKQIDIEIKKGNTNKFDLKTSKTFGQIIFENVFNLFNIINTLIFSLLLFVGSYRNLLFMGVVISNTLIGIVQEIRAKIIIDKLKILNEAKVNVIRENKEETINTNSIVLGETILLQSSSQIPVDGIINETSFLEVNESLITGESEPVEKSSGDTVYSGSFVISGNATITATAVGKDSFSGKLTLEAKKHKKFSSEIIYSLQKIIRILSYAIGPLGILLFLSQYFFSNQPWQDAIVSTAGGIIGMIPAGLILLISLAFAVSVIKLAKYNTLISENFALEQLARVDTICFDKTGTITKGDLVVDKVIYKTKDIDNIKNLIVNFIANTTDNNSTAHAMRDFFGKTEPFKCDFVLPFSSSRKLSAVSFNENDKYVLGAPEYILKTIDNDIKDYMESGYRVICFAKYFTELDNVKNESVPLAFILITDKLRDNLKEVFEYFKKQNVDIKIISGDNPITVSTTAQKAGFEHANSYVDMSQYDQNYDFMEIVTNNNIFGRVTPSQ